MADAVDELKRVLRERNALIICGAGVSMAATGGKAPGWKALIDRAFATAKTETKAAPTEAWVKSCETYLASARVNDWLEAADTIRKFLKGEEFEEFLRQAVSSLAVTDPALPDAIRSLGAPVATTNYDSCLTKNFGRDAATWRKHRHVADILEGRSEDIWHIHGHWQDAESVVFSGDDYARVRASDLSKFLLQYSALGKTLIFIGCSADGLGDENVGALLEWFGKNFGTASPKHYVLVPDGRLNDAWPDVVIPVSCGPSNADLPGFVHSLAPPRDDYRLLPDPHMIGRQDRLDELIGLLLAGETPIVIPGGPGMGKSTLALAAAYNTDIKAKWPNRYFVALDSAREPRGILAGVAVALGVSATGAEAAMLAGIEARLAAGPVLVILDNAETPYVAEPDGTHDILQRLSALHGLVLLVTIRGETPGLGVGKVLDDIEQLDDNAARKLFVRESEKPKLETDAQLGPLLKAMDGHPLSIILLAARAKGQSDLKLLLKEWESKKSDILKRGAGDKRLTNTRVSLGLSLANPACDGDAKRLLSLLAFLPIGAAEGDLDAILPEAGTGAAMALERLRLAARRGGRISVLAPLRECIRLDCIALEVDRERLFDFVLKFAEQAELIGQDGWNKIADEIVLQAGNFDEIAKAALAVGRTPLRLWPALQGMAALAGFSGEGGVTALVAAAHDAKFFGDHKTEVYCIQRLADTSLQRSDYDNARNGFEEALQLFQLGGNVGGAASCLLKLGDISLARSDYEGARKAYEAALPMFRQMDSMLGEANCIKCLGDISVDRSDNNGAFSAYKKALPLYRQVGDVLGMANCIQGLGDVSLLRSDPGGALEAYAEALPLYRQVGALFGVANCTMCLADILFRFSDYEGAQLAFEEALPLYRQIGDVLGAGNCIVGLGNISLRRSDYERARWGFKEALDLFQRIPEPFSVGMAHTRLMRIAHNETERVHHREAARVAWATIGRDDLIAKHLDKQFPDPLTPP
jgi:tetratricopeptide (TPR) repeat protein